jgi:hypothetical protein
VSILGEIEVACWLVCSIRLKQLQEFAKEEHVSSFGKCWCELKKKFAKRITLLHFLPFDEKRIVTKL